MKVRTEQVRKIRREKDFSQDYMAEILELSQSQYSRIENGECRVNFDKANRIAEILGVSPQNIVGYNKYGQSNNFWVNPKTEIIEINDMKKERLLYIEQIKELKTDKEFLKKQNMYLKQMLDKFIL